ncbi:MAG: tRNA 2-thiouridine(34) synthase MnmA [Bacteroidetes bacterium]|nr:tRNA 2-thiouridine(34) synthase MnmA [Bacteroidota bacterium]
MSKKGRILVAMSGGIDSSVTAMLLHEEGYEVIGLTMKTWDYAGSSNKKETGCCTLDSINDARVIAVQKGFPHYILDIRSEFGDYVIDNFVDEYMAGRTPNPCVLCNTHIKWDALIRRADMLDCEFIATGHYAQVRKENGRYVISKGIDTAKDQSYVLWGLTQDAMARTKFPIGNFRKSEIRDMASKMGFDELSKKGESYEICFIPNNDYREFLKFRAPDKVNNLDGGNFIDTTGNVIGKHKGYPFYTIGQRKGLEIAFGQPMYVTHINPKTNTVTLGQLEELDRTTMLVRDYNLQKYATIDGSLDAITKIRYKDPGSPSTIQLVGDKVEVTFNKKVAAIAPGQSAVFYEDNDVIGGGFIERQD